MTATGSPSLAARPLSNGSSPPKSCHPPSWSFRGSAPSRRQAQAPDRDRRRRLYVKKLVGEVLDRVDLFDNFGPRRDYKLTVADTELTAVERNARAASSPDDIELEL